MSNNCHRSKSEKKTSEELQRRKPECLSMWAILKYLSSTDVTLVWRMIKLQMLTNTILCEYLLQMQEGHLWLSKLPDWNLQQMHEGGWKVPDACTKTQPIDIGQEKEASLISHRVPFEIFNHNVFKNFMLFSNQRNCILKNNISILQLLY